MTIFKKFKNRKKKYHDPMTLMSDFFSEHHAATVRRISRNRIFFGAVVFSVLYGTIALKTFSMAFGDSEKSYHHNLSGAKYSRGEIFDRNGIVMATQLKIANLIVNPSKIIDPDEAFDALIRIFPDISEERLDKILYNPKRRYALLKRNISPVQQQMIHDLGIPGIIFETGNMRFYPQNNLASHILGTTDIDKNGIAGLEKQFDKTLKSLDSTQNNHIDLSLDLRVQNIVRNVLIDSIKTFNAIGASAVVMDVKTGEILSLVSLPDFNPNHKINQHSIAMFNRATVGAYEMGSTFKIINSAIALDTKSVDMDDTFDVSKNIYIGGHYITDFHRKNGTMAIGEVLQKSSNIGSAHIADEFGPHIQKYYMQKLGLLERPKIELPERGAPIIPSNWGRVEMMTISYGHGLAVTPLQMTSAVASIVNGGIFVEPTIIKQKNNNLHQASFIPNNTPYDKLQQLSHLWKTSELTDYFKKAGTIMPQTTMAQNKERIISAQTSQATRDIMRLVCTKGSGRRADVPGYPVIGKTGTAEKTRSDGKGYDKKAKISSFVGAFPYQNPEYVVYVMVDEPKPNLNISHYATGGIVAAPAVGNIIKQIAPLLNVRPAPPPELKLAPRNNVLNVAY